MTKDLLCYFEQRFVSQSVVLKCMLHYNEDFCFDFFIILVIFLLCIQNGMFLYSSTIIVCIMFNAHNFAFI